MFMYWEQWIWVYKSHYTATSYIHMRWCPTKSAHSKEYVPFTCMVLEHAHRITAYERRLNIVQPALLLPPFHTEKNDENCGLMVQRGAPMRSLQYYLKKTGAAINEAKKQCSIQHTHFASSGMPLIDSIGRVLSSPDDNAIISRGSPKSPHSWHPLHLKHALGLRHPRQATQPKPAYSAPQTHTCSNLGYFTYISWKKIAVHGISGE